MAVKLFVVGKTKEDYFIDSEAEYFKRIRKYAKLQYEVFPASKNETSALLCLEQEEERIFKALKDNDFVVLLDEAGVQYNSRPFADQLNKWLTGNANTVFVIGGAFGFSDNLRKRSNALLSLSKMTMPHHLVRTVFLEQMYRAFTILNGEHYHND